MTAGFALFLLGDAAVRAGLPTMLLLAPWVLIAVWVVYALSFASHVRTDVEGVTVQNFVRRTSFGWAHVREIDLRWQLEFALDDSSIVTAMGGPARSRSRRQSADEGDGSRMPPDQTALAEIREMRRTAPRRADAPIRRTWDWTAILVLVALVVWAGVAVALTR